MRGHLIEGEEMAGAGRGAVQAGEDSWSRAGLADLERALESLAPVDPGPALRAWRRAGELLAAASGEWLGLALGLSAGEGHVLAAEAAALSVPLPPADDVGGGDGGDGGDVAIGPRVLRADWRGLLGDLGAALGESFRAGRAALVLADPLLPGLAQSWGEMLIEAGLSPRALAVLHAHDPAVATALADAGQRIEVVGPTRGGVLRVARRDDPVAAAAHAARAAFARVPGLAGQRGHGPRLVVCNDRRFAAFTEALLGELATLARSARLRPIDPRAAGELSRAVELALDGGATPIHGCEGAFEPCVLTNAPATSVAPPPGLPLILLARARGVGTEPSGG